MKNLEKFYDAVKENKALQQEAEALNEEFEGQDMASKETQQQIAEQLVQLAAKHGIEITVKDLLEQQVGELSEDELDAVAGGGQCVCVIGGGGKIPPTGTYDNGAVCACVVAGFGERGSCTGNLCNCFIAGAGDF